MSFDDPSHRLTRTGMARSLSTCLSRIERRQLRELPFVCFVSLAVALHFVSSSREHLGSTMNAAVSAELRYDRKD